MGRKVLFVHDGHLYRDATGALYGAQVNDQLIERYRFFGSHVSFILREKPLDPDERTTMDRISDDRFRFIPLPEFKRLGAFLARRRQVNGIIEQAVRDHDVIVARMPSLAGRAAIRAAQRIGKPLLVEVVACTFDAYWNHSWRGKLVAHARYHAVRRIIRGCAHVIYVTERFLQQRYPTHGRHIGVSDVELPPVDPEVLERRLRRIAAWERGQPLTLGTVGGLAVAYKRQADVIRAVARLRRRGIRWRYVLIGEGDPSRLQAVIDQEGVGDLVTILGSRPHHEVFPWLEGIDVYIQPSKQEGLPRSLVEAMSRACPALGSDIAGIPELLDRRSLFRAGDVADLCVRLTAIDRSWLETQARRNFAQAQRFDAGRLAEARRVFYELFLRERAPDLTTA